jgi:hypothetical protein
MLVISVVIIVQLMVHIMMRQDEHAKVQHRSTLKFLHMYSKMKGQ